MMQEGLCWVTKQTHIYKYLTLCWGRHTHTHTQNMFLGVNNSMCGFSPCVGEYATQEMTHKPTLIEIILTAFTAIIFVLSVWSGLIQIKTQKAWRQPQNHNQNRVVSELSDYADHSPAEDNDWREQNKLDLAERE